MTASVFFGNTADEGGAIFVEGGDLALDGVIIQDNQADASGAVGVDGGFPVLTNVTLAGNGSSDGGVVGVTSGYVALVNTILAESTDGWGLYTDSTSAASLSTLRYDDAWHNASGDYGGAFTDPTGTDGNIAADPLFVSWTADGSQKGDDLHLQPGSPCIDAGYPGWTDADGSVSDIGAFGGGWEDLIDYDGDFFLVSEGDCDDSDAATYPGATEIPYDGADNDCAGDGDLTDVDGDGFDATEAGGEDCDDGDATVNPDADETWYDGVDSDCDGQSDYDADGDGHDSQDHGGDDPDDTDPDVGPATDDTGGADDTGAVTDDTGPMGDSAEPGDDGSPEGCACQGKGTGGTFGLLLLPLALRRRS